MTIALWTLIAFAAWTLILLLFGVGIRRWYLILSRQAAIASFPGDVAHGSPAYWRAMRAHANCVENLPVYAVIVRTAEITHLIPAHMDILALVVIVGRVAQSSVHMLLPETNVTVAIRFLFFSAQLAAMIWMIVAMARMAIASP